MPDGPGRWIDLGTVTDARGSITFMDAPGPIPFPVRLVYYLHGVPPGARRGNHAHRALREVLIPVAGSLTVRLEGRAGKRTYRADDPKRGLLIEPMTWLELEDFAPGTVCLLLGSQPYDEAENIRDHGEFRRLLEGLA